MLPLPRRMSLRAAILLIVAQCSLGTGNSALRADVSAPASEARSDSLLFFPAPRNQAELNQVMTRLRAHYAPFLRSLPPPVNTRTRTVLGGPWRGRDEDTPKKPASSVSEEEKMLHVNSKKTFKEKDAEQRDFLAEEEQFLESGKAPDWWKPELDDSSWDTADVPGFRAGDEKVVWYRTAFDAATPKPDERGFLHFGGADHRAQVWLNGVYLGEHVGYFEDFRFDVTRLLKPRNVLAVRLINGYMEPHANVCTLPKAFLTADRESSLATWRGGGHGNGYGLFRPVVLETSHATAVRGIFVRGDPDKATARVDVEIDAQEAGDFDISVELLPENFEGPSFRASATRRVEASPGRQRFEVASPDARRWSPDTPHLYRCRVSLRRDGRLLDASDALFGFKTFAIATGREPGVRRGQFILNGQPVFLRGTNVQYLNTPILWGDRDSAIDTLLMVRAAHFNYVRNIQHMPWPETRELEDRLGIVYENEAATVTERTGYSERAVAQGEALAHAAARVSYNNAGAVMLCLLNEGAWFKIDGRRLCEAAWRADPELIIKPASGGWPHLPAAFWKEHFTRLVVGHHDYNGWYPEANKKTDIRFLAAGIVGATPARPGFNPRGEASQGPVSDAGHLYMVGEYGSEGKDAIETFASYPKQWGKPPPPETIGFWHPSQARLMGKPDDPRGRYAIGLRGRLPRNMADMIEASQTYQADQLGGLTRGYRLASEGYAGYEQFHFKDMLPNQWQKSIVSYDFRPKKAYFEMAQCNQPVAPLFVIDKDDRMTLWVDNDLPQELHGLALNWRLTNAAGLDLRGEQAVPPVRALSSAQVHEIDLQPLPRDMPTATITLELSDPTRHVIARYERELYLPAMRPLQLGSDAR